MRSMNSAIVRAAGIFDDGFLGLARRIGVSAPSVHEWASGKRPTPPVRCALIEFVTRGKVTCEQIRSDVVWVRIPDAAWPHPGGRPAIDVCSKKLEWLWQLLELNEAVLAEAA